MTDSHGFCYNQNMARLKDIASQPLPADFKTPEFSGGLPDLPVHVLWRLSGMIPDDDNYIPFKRQFEYGSPAEDSSRRRMLVPPQNPDVS